MLISSLYLERKSYFLMGKIQAEMETSQGTKINRLGYMLRGRDEG